MEQLNEIVRRKSPIKWLNEMVLWNGPINSPIKKSYDLVTWTGAIKESYEIVL